MLTLGSLFSGSGGFELAGILCGIEPRWASEIEPFPIRVTTKRLPGVRHLGDIRGIDGAKVEPVDVVTFGSPCQDLSVAGKRAGLGGERSGLFMEAIRIIKEMREATNGRCPTFAVWENVGGVFSSNKGEDFRAVLGELVGVSEPGAEVPAPEKGGWPYADVYMGDGWSVAYRTLDAQYFGVPQRRRRIFLVADFAGGRAGEVLFEPGGLRRDIAQGAGAGQGATGGAEGCAGGAGRDGQVIPFAAAAFAANQRDEVRGLGDCAAAIQARPGMKQQTFVAVSAGCLNPWESQRRRICGDGGVSPALDGCDGGGGRNPGGFVLAAVFDGRGNGIGDLVNTIVGDHESRINNNCSLVVAEGFPGGAAFSLDSLGSNAMKSKNPLSGCREADKAGAICAAGPAPGGRGGLAILCAATQQGGAEILRDKCPTVTAAAGSSGNNQPYICAAEPVCYRDKIGALCAADYKGQLNMQVDQGKMVVEAVESSGAAGAGAEGQPSYGLDRASFNQGSNEQFDIGIQEEQAQSLVAKGPGGGYAVRRLTPLECCRLQGFPDFWAQGLGTPEPSEEDIDFWVGVFGTYANIMGGKPKSRAQIVKWLRDPHSDAAEYRMWGNGVALPCVAFVLGGIAAVAGDGAGGCAYGKEDCL